MALVCSPNSASWAKPSLPASELRDTTGNTTLMVWSVTPRDEVLALPTGVGPEPEPTRRLVGRRTGAGCTRRRRGHPYTGTDEDRRRP